MAILPITAAGLSLPGQIRPSLPSQFAVPQGLVGYWGLDPDCLDFSNNLALDLSAQKNNGALVSVASSLLTNGQVGTAIAFDGTASKITASPYDLSAYSWCMWMNSHAPSAATEQPLVNGSTQNAWGFSWDHASAAFRQAAFHVTSGAAFVAAKITDTLAANTWYFIVGTWDGANLRVYNNAVLQATTAVNTKITATGSLVFGGSAAPLWAGKGDDIRIYNRALDPGEIITLYQTGLAGLRDAGPLMGQDIDAMAMGSAA